MTIKIEGTIAIIAALFVLFTALLSPVISAGIAIVVLTVFGIYKLIIRGK